MKSELNGFYVAIMTIMSLACMLIVWGVIIEAYQQNFCEKEEFHVTGIKGIYRGSVIYETDKGDIIYNKGFREGDTFITCKRQQK